VGKFKMVPDGFGGVIFLWKDFRGAAVGIDYYNNSLYMQRVDKDGNIIWENNGVMVAPLDGGNKEASIVNDGLGGVMVLLAESDFRRDGAAKKEWSWIQHYDKNGVKTWDFLTDSSDTSFRIFPPDNIYRLDSITRLSIRDDVKFITNNGVYVDNLKY